MLLKFLLLVIFFGRICWAEVKGVPDPKPAPNQTLQPEKEQKNKASFFSLCSISFGWGPNRPFSPEFSTFPFYKEIYGERSEYNLGFQASAKIRNLGYFGPTFVYLLVRDTAPGRYEYLPGQLTDFNQTDGTRWVSHQIYGLGLNLEIPFQDYLIVSGSIVPSAFTMFEHSQTGEYYSGVEIGYVSKLGFGVGLNPLSPLDAKLFLQDEGVRGSYLYAELINLYLNSAKNRYNELLYSFGLKLLWN